MIFWWGILYIKKRPSWRQDKQISQGSHFLKVIKAVAMVTEVDQWWPAMPPNKANTFTIVITNREIKQRSAAASAQFSHLNVPTSLYIHVYESEESYNKVISAILLISYVNYDLLMVQNSRRGPSKFYFGPYFLKPMC